MSSQRSGRCACQISNSSTVRGRYTRRAASAIEKSLPQRTEAVVYSHRALLIGGHGVTVRELAASTSPYGFQYLGLRVLVHANGTWFLVPAGWTGGNEDLVVLLADDDPEIRVDLRP